MGSIKPGRGDLGELGDRIMGQLKALDEDDRANGRGAYRPETVCEYVDTLYYAVQERVGPPPVCRVDHHAIVLRGMHPRVPVFECQAQTRARLERAIVNAYLDALLNVGLSGEEARRRAGTCKLELVDREMVPLYARGTVMVGGGRSNQS